MDGAMEKIVTIGVAIIGVATLAVLVSRNSNTAGVIGAAGGAFAQALNAATRPVSGGGGLDSTGFTPIM